jgi:hypothetical protein
MNTAMRQLLLLLVVGVSCDTISIAADGPPFSITVSSPQDTWKAGSDVVITISITNTSNRTVFLRTGTGQGDDELFSDIEVEDDLGHRLPRRPTGDLVAGSRYIKKTFLKPTETLKENIVISKLFDLSRSGKYTVRVQRRDPDTNSVVTANIAIVTVPNRGGTPCGGE